MPPSISGRPATQVLRHDDDTHAMKQSQSVRDFRARKKLLAGKTTEPEKKQAKGKRVATTKQPVSSSSAAEVSSTAAAAAAQRTNNDLALTSEACNTTGGVLNNSTSPYGGLGVGGYGMGMGYGMYGGMMGSPYMGGMMGGPLNGLNQFLFGVQTVIYSLSSAVQVIGMNTHAMHQLLDAASSMVDHAIATFHEMRALEASANAHESEEQKMRRRRLKALRWALVVAATYSAYRLIRNMIMIRSNRNRRRRLTADIGNQSSVPHGGSYSSAYPSQRGYMPSYSSYPGMGSYGGYGSSFGYGSGYY